MKLKIDLYCETNWRYGYIGFKIDNKRWCSFIIRNDNRAKLYNYSDIIK